MYKLLTIILFGLSSMGWMDSSYSTLDEQPIKVTKVYPNPATTVINFEFDQPLQDEEYSLAIYSFIGKKIQDIKINTRKITLSLTNYYRGIYIFQVIDRNGQVVESGKFQVVR